MKRLLIWIIYPTRSDKGQPLQERLRLEWATEAVQAHRLRPMITKDSIETAYSFLHQKRNVYIHSTLDWQKDDIELAIDSYVDDMNQELYETISDGRIDFLRNHRRFGEDITQAVERLENMYINIKQNQNESIIIKRQCQQEW